MQMTETQKVSKIPLGWTKIWLAILLFSPLLQAQSEDFEETSFERHIQELQAKQSPKEKPKEEFEEIELHGGMGLVNSIINLKVQNKELYRYQSGFCLNVGIDLFSPAWFAEGSIVNYGTKSTFNDKFSLREFDLKVLNRSAVGGIWSSRLGVGLASRYLKYENYETRFSQNVTTPSSIWVAGLEARIVPQISLGVEANLRISLLSDTIDRNTLDLLVRLDSHF